MPKFHAEVTNIILVTLGLVIGKGGSNIAPENAHHHMAGYILALDAALESKEIDTSIRHSMDTFCPVSYAIGF